MTTYFATYTHRNACDNSADYVDATTGFGPTQEAANRDALVRICLEADVLDAPEEVDADTDLLGLLNGYEIVVTRTHYGITTY